MPKALLNPIIRTSMLALLAGLPVLVTAQVGVPAIVDRVTQQQVDRVQQQAADKAQTQATDKAQSQVQTQVLTQVATQIGAQVVEKVQQQIDTAQQRVSDQAQTKQETKIQAQVVGQVESQVDRVQAQAAGRAQATVEQAQTQAAERAQTVVNKVQQQVERAAQRTEQTQGKTQDKAQHAVDKATSRTTTVTATVTAAVVEKITGNSTSTTPTTVTVDAQQPRTVNAASTSTTAQPSVRNVAAAPFVEVTVTPGVRAVQFEWVMLVTPAQRQQLNTESAQLLQFLTDSQAYALTGGEMLKFSVPPDLDANDAILNLVPTNLRDQIDRNHVYVTQNHEHTDGQPLPLPFAAVCDAPVALGLIDSAINTAHPAFAALAATPARVQARSFVETNLVTATAHGTAVASVLVGEHVSTEVAANLHPLLPKATLYSAAVFHEDDKNVVQGAPATRLLAALDWLVNEPQVRVINMSLAGPPNRLLQQVLATVRQKGKLIVAAVGNEGPNGTPRYPAAYDDVIGVTAVDRNGAVFRWANQGPQVDFAALGVDVPTAGDHDGFTSASGTSVAAPVVAAFLACALQKGVDIDKALAQLQQQTVDLGKPGKDTVFGQGLLHPGVSPAKH